MEVDVRVRVHRSASVEVLADLASLFLLLNAFALLAGMRFGAAFTAVAYAYLAGDLCLLLALLGLRRVAGRRRVRVTADASGLRVGRRHYPRRAMRAGFVLPPAFGNPPGVYVDGEQRLTLDVATVEQGEALVRALDLTGRSRALRYRVSGPLPFGPVTAALGGLVVLGIVGSGFVSPYGAIGLSAAVLVAMFHEPILAWLCACNVDVGSDGVNVESLSVRRFFTPGELVSVDDRSGGVTLVTLRSTLRIAQPTASSEDVRRNAELAARIREVIAARTASSAAAEQLLARRDAPVDAWLASLHVRVEDGYRSASLGNDELERALVSAASPTVRVAAAVLLRARGADASRLRVAAEAVAEPKLRAALTAVAEGRPEDELEAAVASLDDGAPRTDAST